MKVIKTLNWKVLCAIAWFLLTLSLIVWWMVLGMRSIEPSKQGMILMEGMTLIVSFVIGGVLLIRFLIHERARNLRLQEFFAVFNHEIKTYITSLRLKVEGLSMDMDKVGNSLEAKKIVDDTVRLELQLENSLFLANPKTSKMFKQNIRVKELLKSLELNWDDIKLVSTNDSVIYADQRAIETILKNIIQNARVHGGATVLHVDSSINENMIEFKITNNGSPFDGDLTHLGKLFYRHGRTSKSGVGVYLIKKLSNAMGGNLRFEINEEHNLVYILSLKRGCCEG